MDWCVYDNGLRLERVNALFVLGSCLKRFFEHFLNTEVFAQSESFLAFNKQQDHLEEFSDQFLSGKDCGNLSLLCTIVFVLSHERQNQRRFQHQ